MFTSQIQKEKNPNNCCLHMSGPIWRGLMDWLFSPFPVIRITHYRLLKSKSHADIDFTVVWTTGYCEGKQNITVVFTGQFHFFLK